MSEKTTAVTVQEPQALAHIDPAQVVNQVKVIHQVMRDAMQEGTHFGVIPGCGSKPSLLKAGAEKICFTFRLAPEYEVSERELEAGHREYQVTATLRHLESGKMVSHGVGLCSTEESKYCTRKNIADTYNTVLKMAKKRAYVDAVISATACSDIFTQDIEDISQNQKASGEKPAADPIMLAEKIPDDYRANKAKYNADGYFCRKNANSGKWEWWGPPTATVTPPAQPTTPDLPFDDEQPPIEVYDQ